MKYLVTTFVLLTLTLSCRSQETKEYLVYNSMKIGKRAQRNGIQVIIYG